MLQITCDYCAYCVDEAMMLRERGRDVRREEERAERARQEQLRAKARSQAY